MHLSAKYRLIQLPVTRLKIWLHHCNPETILQLIVKNLDQNKLKEIVKRKKFRSRNFEEIRARVNPVFKWDSVQTALTF